MRSAIALLIITASLAGCGWGEIDIEEMPMEPVSSSDTQVSVDPSVYESPKTSELGTDRTRGQAKTLEWQQVGTEMGATYCGGAVVVDHVIREDADNWYGVRVRVKNTQNNVEKLQWRISFYNAKGERFLSLNETWKEGEWNETWKSNAMDPLGLLTVTDACRLKGAVSYRLFLRRQGSNDAGNADGFGKP